jgi:hypothetical protein
MLSELRNFIKGYPDNFGFHFDEGIVLWGLKFSCKEKYPWKNRREMKDFFEKLYAHKSSECFQKIIDWKTILHQERIHILYSMALILRLSSLIMITAGLVLIALQLLLPSVILACSGILMLILDLLFRRMASRSHQSWLMITGLLKILIEKRGKEHTEAA